MIEDDITWGLGELRARAQQYDLWKAYDEGRHRLGLASEKMRTAFRHLFSAFALNLCPRVIDGVADRIQIIGFSEADSDGGTHARAAELWEHSLMPQQAGQVHRTALVAGDAHVIVWPDDRNVPTLYPQRTGEVVVRYSASRPGEVLFALKAWRSEDGHYRVTLYRPEGMYRFRTTRKSDTIPERVTALTPTDDEPQVPNPWGQVPVFHFANDAPVGRPGVSSLRDVVPVQDALNKAVIDIMVGSESSALPQRWASGIQDDTDEFGRLKPLPVTPGSVLTSQDPASRFGEFGAGDLRQLVAVKESFASDVAAVSAMPLHELLAGTGGWPSGEALKTSEAPRNKRCADRIATWSPVWSSAMSLALQMGGQPAAVRTIFDSPETRTSPVEQANAAVAKQAAGIPIRQTWREMGYTAERIEAMWLERQAEQASSAEAAARAFNAGAAA